MIEKRSLDCETVPVLANVGLSGRYFARMAGEVRESVSGERILLFVDDDPLQLSAMQRQARGRARSIVATTDVEAIELARRERPQVAIVDYFLGRTFGDQLIAPLREIDSTMKIAVASAGFTAGIAAQATRAGADAVVEKPFDLMFALRTIEEGATAVERPQEIRSLAQVEEAHIRRVLVVCEFNISRSARYLGIRPNTLREKIDRAGIPLVSGRRRLPK